MKKIVRENVLQLIQKSTGPLKPRESGVTRLTALGLANGTAQRILDDASDIQLETVERLASALKVSPVQLMTPGAQTPSMLFRDLDTFEGMLLNLFRDLPRDDDRHEAIVDLNLRRDRARERDRVAAGAATAADAGNPYAGAKNRRDLVQGRIPERRVPDRKLDSPLSLRPAPSDGREKKA